MLLMRHYGSTQREEPKRLPYSKTLSETAMVSCASNTSILTRSILVACSHTNYLYILILYSRGSIYVINPHILHSSLRTTQKQKATIRTWTFTFIFFYLVQIWICRWLVPRPWPYQPLHGKVCKILRVGDLQLGSSKANFYFNFVAMQPL